MYSGLEKQVIAYTHDVMHTYILTFIHTYMNTYMNTCIEHLIAINKPASMPVHPSGAYNFNTLISILTYENYAQTNSSDFQSKDHQQQQMQKIDKKVRKKRRSPPPTKDNCEKKWHLPCKTLGTFFREGRSSNQKEFKWVSLNNPFKFNWIKLNSFLTPLKI